MRSEGVRRLSLAVGGILTLPGIGLMLLGLLGSDLDFGLAGLPIAALGFFVGWGLVRLIAWIVAGFRSTN